MRWVKELFCFLISLVTVSRGGSRPLGMWQTKFFRDVMVKDSVRPPIMGACLHSCCCPEQSQCRAFAEIMLWEKASAKCGRFAANKQEGQFFFKFSFFLKFFLINLWGRKIWLFKEFLCKGGKCWSATARNPSEKRYRSYIELPVEIIWSGRPERPAGILFHQRLMEASHSNVLKAVEN